jgi:hypothetical protein
MTDRYEDIRKALAMGPTPGPRRASGYDSHPYVTVALPENEGHRWDDPIICTLYEDVTPDDYVGFGERLQSFPNARANAALIAACDPDTIRALLAERDALQRKLSLWEPIMAEIDRRAGKECCLEDRCDFTVTVGYEEYAAIAAANGSMNG